jgi:hypothetical protein
MTYELEKQARYARQVQQLGQAFRRVLSAQRNGIALDSRPQSRLTSLQQRLKGALFSYIGPRLALDAEMPDLDRIVEGVGRDTPSRRIASRLRSALRGRVARDVDLDDFEALLEALEEMEEGEEGEDEEELQASEYREPQSDPWREPARDRRARRALDDPAPFSGRPQTGGRMDPMSNRNDTRFPKGGAPADKGPVSETRGGPPSSEAIDRLPHRARAGDIHRPRHFGAHDSANNSFRERFAFTNNARTDSGSGIFRGKDVA